MQSEKEIVGNIHGQYLQPGRAINLASKKLITKNLPTIATESTTIETVLTT
jgi:hypothetical protein